MTLYVETKPFYELTVSAVKWDGRRLTVKDMNRSTLRSQLLRCYNEQSNNKHKIIIVIACSVYLVPLCLQVNGVGGAIGISMTVANPCMVQVQNRLSFFKSPYSSIGSFRHSDISVKAVHQRHGGHILTYYMTLLTYCRLLS